jgi:hypothetical protein
MKACTWLLVLLVFVGSYHEVGGAPLAQLVKKGTATQLIVDGEPFVMLAGELHNSSSTGLAYMQRVWPKLEALGLNTVIATASWELVEPQEGRFDFSLIDGIVAQARRHDMRLVLLWFGSWKNGVSSYVPAWVKKDTERFPRCLGSSNLNTKNVLTPLSEENQQADARAFAALMCHLREIDGEHRTVIMVQVENEVGIKPEPRDLSPRADAAFQGPVPKQLMSYLAAHKDSLIPELRSHWEKTGFRTSGTWTEVFGEGRHTDEIFSAWHYATYIGAVVEAGKAQYPLPMYVNAWLRAPGAKPGDYPSGGPLAHVMDIWRAGGPHIDFFAPDIYLPDFKGICDEYTQSGNPLMIPEASTDDQAVARAFWAVAQHDALCFAPFGIEHCREDHPLGEGYAILRQLMPFVAAAHGSDRMVGIYRQDREKQRPDEPVVVGHYRANIRYMTRGIPNDAPRYGLIIQTGAEEFLVAGYGFQVNFRATTPGPRYTGILDVEMGHFESGRWLRELHLNGDETGANHVAKIPPNTRNTFLDPSRPRILKVRVYRHD